MKTLTAIAAAMVLFALVTPARGGLIWYSSETAGPGQWSHLYTIDTASGAIVDRGVIHEQRYITDLAMADDGTLYGVGWANAYANSTSKLYTIAPGSASTWAEADNVSVHANQMDRQVNSAVMLGGDLYVASMDGTFQKLVKDDKKGWMVDESDNMGYSIGGDLAFSADGSKLYVALDGGRLGTVNFDTTSHNFGKVSVIGNTGYSQLYGLAYVDGALWATTNDSSNYAISKLVRLDERTGQGVDVYNLGVPVWGITANSNVAVPEPMSLALLAGGSLLLLARRAPKGLTV